MINVANDRPEAALFNNLDQVNTIAIGPTSAVGGTGEFADIVGGDFRQGGGENDLLLLLGEVLYGDGVDSVVLNTLDDDTATLELSNAEVVGPGRIYTDTVVFDNAAGVVGALALGFVDAGNDRREFGFFDLAEDDAFLVLNTASVGTTGEFARIVGGGLERGDLRALFGEVLEGGGVDGVELISLDDDSVTLALTNAGGVPDVLAVDNAGGILAEIYH